MDRAPRERRTYRRASLVPVTMGLMATIMLVASSTVAFAATPEVVLNDPGTLEFYSSASDGYLVWSAADGLRVRSYVMADGGSPVLIDRNSYAPSIDGTTIVYEKGLNLRFFDAVTHVRSAPPPGVNTANVEYRPTLSGDQLLFTRSNRNRVPFHDAWIKVVLFNLSTETSTVLRTLRYTPYYFVSDQVNGDWATFESCRVIRGRGIYTNCQVFRYKISTAELEQIANPGLQQYAAAVSGDGTVYLTRSGNRDHWTCGGHAKLVRYPVGEPGVVIATLPDDKDALTTFALDETDGSTTMYFDRSTCRTRRGLSGGIYRVLNADTAA